MELLTQVKTIWINTTLKSYLKLLLQDLYLCPIYRYLSICICLYLHTDWKELENVTCVDSVFYSVGTQNKC